MSTWILWYHPLLLGCILLLAGVFWWLERPLLSRQRWLWWGMRWLASSALVCAIAAPVIVGQSSRTALMIVRDRSQSIDPVMEANIQEVIRQLQQTRPEDAMIGIVDVGADTAVAAMPSSGPLDASYAQLRNYAGTALMQGIVQASLQLPAGYIPHMLVLSDGNETLGRVLDAVPALQARGVRVDAVRLAGATMPVDAGIRQISAPQSSRGQGQISLNVDIVSSQPQPAVLTVLREQTVVLTRSIMLTGTPQREVVSLSATAYGQQRVTVRLDAAQDRQSDDNQRQVIVQRAGPPRLLVLSAEADRAAPFIAAARRTGSTVDWARPTEITAQLVGLSSYDAIIVIDTPAAQIPVVVQQHIQTLVRQVGRGFVWIGGADSMGAGGFRRTPLADIAAVSLNPIDTAQEQRFQLVLVIDRSGSMSDMIGAVSQLDMAKEAAFQAVRALRPNDAVAIAFFDDVANWALPSTIVPDDATIAQALGNVVVGGGTSIRAGLLLAMQAATTIDADVRHVILLSDGQDTQPLQDVVAQLRRQQMTVSTVALGAAADRATLAALAQAGQGRSYVIDQPQQLPQVFLNDTVEAAGYDIVEGEFVPQVRDMRAWPLDTLQAPLLYGYNRTSVLSDTRVLLQIDADTPLWATRRVGNGVSTVWNSDLGGRWGRDWVTSGAVDQLVPALLSDVLPNADAGLDVRWYWHDDILEVDVAGVDRADAAPQAQLIDATGTAIPLTLQAISAQQWQALIRDLPSGEYIIDVRDATQHVVRGLIIDGRREFANDGQGLALLNSLTQQTGGQLWDRIDAPTFWAQTSAIESITSIQHWFIVLAMLIYVSEIALRRLGGGRVLQAAYTRWRQRTGARRPSPQENRDTHESPSPTPYPTYIDTLREARQRARDRVKSDHQRD